MSASASTAPGPRAAGRRGTTGPGVSISSTSRTAPSSWAVVWTDRSAPIDSAPTRTDSSASASRQRAYAAGSGRSIAAQAAAVSRPESGGVGVVQPGLLGRAQQVEGGGLRQVVPAGERPDASSVASSSSRTPARRLRERWSRCDTASSASARSPRDTSALPNTASSVPAIAARPSATSSRAASGRPAHSSTSAAVSVISRSQPRGAPSASITSRACSHRSHATVRSPVATVSRAAQSSTGAAITPRGCRLERLVDQLLRLREPPGLDQRVAGVAQQQASRTGGPGRSGSARRSRRGTARRRRPGDRRGRGRG